MLSALGEKETNEIKSPQCISSELSYPVPKNDGHFKENYLYLFLKLLFICNSS